MNILIINSDSQPQFIGGIKRVAVTLASQWIVLGHSVSFVCLCNNELKYDNVAGIPQAQLPNTVDVCSKENKGFLSAYINENNIDVILHPFLDCRELSYLCFDVAEQTKTKTVTAWHFSPDHFLKIVDESFFIRYKKGNRFVRYSKDLVYWLRWHLYKREQVRKDWSVYFKECSKRCDKKVLLSDRYIPEFSSLYGVSEESLISINNPNIFQQEGSIDLSSKEKIVLWVGRVGYGMKRTDKMLSIWKLVCQKHPDWKLLVCGSGNTECFISLAKDMKLKNIEFLGFVDPKEYYHKASIICNTSVTEGWPLVLMEPLAYGCVPMSFDSYSSVYEIIDDGKNGFIIPAFDEGEYARKLEQLILDEDLRRSMAQKGMQSLSRFNQKDIAEQWIKLFDETNNKSNQ